MQFKLGMCFEDFCEFNTDLMQQIFEEEKPHLAHLTNNGDVDPSTDSVVLNVMWDLYDQQNKEAIAEIENEPDTASLLLDKHCEYAC